MSLCTSEVKKKPAGVREIQRMLNLGSSSTAYWHLNKLQQHGIIKQFLGNKYQLVPPYSTLKKIPLTLVLNHYFIGGKAIPNIFILIGYLIITTFGSFFMLLFNLWLQAAFTGFFGLLGGIFLLVHFYYNLLSKFEENSIKKS